MNLLENELVKKYFGCEPLTTQNCYHDYHQCDQAMAHRVLAAMQAPIRKGDKFLLWDGHNVEASNYPIDPGDGYHPYYLRLPDAFQPKTCGKCDVCGYDYQRFCREHTQKLPKCDHSGLKRYCGKDIYCEACKREVSAELTECCFSVPHEGPCQKSDPVEEAIRKIAKIYADPGDTAFVKYLLEIVDLARKTKGDS